MDPKNKEGKHYTLPFSEGRKKQTVPSPFNLSHPTRQHASLQNVLANGLP